MAYDRERPARMKRINSLVVSLSKTRIRSLDGNHLKTLEKTTIQHYFFLLQNPFLYIRYLTMRS